MAKGEVISSDFVPILKQIICQYIRSCILIWRDWSLEADRVSWWKFIVLLNEIKAQLACSRGTRRWNVQDQNAGWMSLSSRVWGSRCVHWQWVSNHHRKLHKLGSAFLIALSNSSNSDVSSTGATLTLESALPLSSESLRAPVSHFSFGLTPEAINEAAAS